MELEIDLLKTKSKKSRIRVLLGILFTMLAISWITIKLIGNNIISPFDWFYFGIMGINGFFHMVEGFGYPFDRLFGKAYILINSDFISIKASTLDKNQIINWSDIKSVEYKLNKFEIIKTDNTYRYIFLSYLDYISINAIKQTIHGIAKEKQITEINASR